ncbi:MAG TPA: TIGR04283 family arsenosugar biosynthesis glycosyltransferase [Longimicrobiaceae bacterium]|nr:TIGR04283 family arsenosugar biosynthesis glycosyltransferase [Longimicrobiaceae bacterium]
MISIILPALDEGAAIADTLRSLQDARLAGHEVVVVDGGSSDNTVALARPHADLVLEGSRGRARQMNQGATAASGEVLLFLHADTVLPDGAALLIADALSREAVKWGRFDVRLSGARPILRVVERLMNLRSRLTGMATGDQAIFVRAMLFERVGGFPDQPIMEDLALSRALLAHSRPACIRKPVITSSRRWEENGAIATIILMWRLRAAYYFGADPERLAIRYSAR